MTPSMGCVINGYGIFGGKNVQWARLRFNPESARWVRHEEWHPDQRLTDEPDGSLVMELPFADERELTMDVLKHGSRVEVVGPAALRVGWGGY
ncbi:MAG: helix-turn-helix transcriptional regulator [Burkholderiales bacterium]